MAELRDNSAELGLNTNSTISQIKKGMLTHAVNAQVESFDGNAVSYQNEQANLFCCEFPTGFKVIGNHSIIEKDMIVFWLVNPTTGECQIGRMLNQDCVYRTDISSKCLNFSLNNRIKRPVHKITNCSIEVYWTDTTINGRRYIDFNNLPYKTVVQGTSTDPCNVTTTSEIDCNKLAIQPDFSIPQINVLQISSEGSTPAGDYQFAVQYCNSLGEEYTSYYSVTNPVPLNDPFKITEDFNYAVNKAIQIDVSNIDITGVFQYFNIAVIRTINNITDVQLVGTFNIEGADQKIIYTGQSKTGTNLTINDIFQKFPVWEQADSVTAIQDILVWQGMTSKARVSYQRIFNQVKLQWSSFRISKNVGDYSSPIIANKYTGYMGDEVYAFDAVILSKKGYQSDRFHIPGRAPTDFDLEMISNNDTQFAETLCDTPQPKPRWQVYNTASISGSNFTPCVEKPTPPDPTNPSGIVEFNIQQHCPDKGCTEQSKTVLTFSLPKPLTQPLSILIGRQYLEEGTILRYQGNSIFTPDPSAVPDPYYDPNFQTPFLVTIPEGVTTYQTTDIIYLNGKPNSFNNVWICQSCNSHDTDLYIAPLDGVTQMAITTSDSYNIHVLNPEMDAGTTQPQNTVTTQGNQTVDCSGDNCYLGPYQFGEFSYWESTETYPCNDEVWGDLQGKKIRHHKFPDSIITNRYDAQGNIYPLGIKLDARMIWELIRTSPDLTQEEKDDVACIKIVRGNRANNKSIIAKGLFYNIGKYRQQATDYYYSNYPYNDINPDPFISVGSNAPVLVNTILNSTVTGNTAVVPTTLTTTTFRNDEYYHGVQVQYEGDFNGDPSGTKQIQIKLTGDNNQAVVFDSGPLSVGAGAHWAMSVDTQYTRNTTDQGHEVWEIVFAVTFSVSGNFSKTISTTNTAFLETFTTPTTMNVIATAPNGNDIVLSQVSGGTLVSTPEVDQLDGFASDESKQRMSFLSPDTTFNQPFLGSISKFETIEYGNSFGHFTQVKDHSRYKFPSLGSFIAALITGVIIGFASGTYGVADNIFNGTAAFTAFTVFNDIVFKLLPRKNFAYSFNSIGNYNQFQVVPNNGNKNRQLDIAAYLVPGMQGVGDVNIVNNYQRESSVYLRMTTPIPFPSENAGIPSDNSRFTLGQKNCINNIYTRDISSYYGSIKNIVPDQYGLIYSYDSVDTGFQMLLDINTEFDNNDRYQYVFGGDTFINKFSLKRKVPFFLDNRVGFPDDADIAYEDVPNIAFTTYWFSTDIQRGDGGNFSIGKLFGVKVNNFDCKRQDSSFFYDAGKIYLFAYGIPTFYVESQVNVAYRQAFNQREGDFYPRVGTSIPDEWLQEKNVSINFDNTYFYNKTFSKQNKENLFTTLPVDFIPNQDCEEVFPNKAIYSDRQQDLINYKKNNWLIYRPVSQFDFPLIYGKMIGIEGITDRSVLAKFENKSMIYNALLTVSTSSGIESYIGNPTLFTGAPPLDFVETDLGYVGTQHELFLRTEYGNLIVDCKRGQVFITNGSKVNDIGEASMQMFFSDQLKFKMQEAYPDYPIDNHYKGVGLTGTYDTKHDRLLITKLDYTPRYTGTTWDKTTDTFKTKEGKLVNLLDPNYFCSVSFTLSYSFKIQAWVSFHSYLPNYYLDNVDQFYSGRNDVEQFYIHNKDINNYNTFYGRIEPYILEYPFAYKIQDEIMQSVSDYTKVQQVLGQVRFIQLDDVYFNKAIIYNDQQCTGILNLIPKPKNNLNGYMKYPMLKPFGKDILVVKSNNIYNYNGFWDLVKDYLQPIWQENCVALPTDKALNQINMDYSSRSFKKYSIIAKDARIRHILDNRGDVRLISQFILTDNQSSFK